MSQPSLDPWYLEHLVCPRDHQPLAHAGAALVCDRGHRYPVIDGVPVMLVEEATPTIDITEQPLKGIDAPGEAPFYLSTLSLSADEKSGIQALAASGSKIDPVVAYLVAATNGLMYQHLIGTLDRYPIPPLPMEEGRGRLLLDIGCSWGRWTLAASERGYDAVGIDPSLGAVMAARRVAASLGRPTHYVVGDARHLPFRQDSFQAAYSYSVIQHFSYEDATRTFAEIARVLKPGAIAKVQMPAKAGVRCLYHQLRRGFREAHGFEVRYWSLPQLRNAFASVGDARFSVDCYFGIGLQASDLPLMTPRLQSIVKLSEQLKSMSHSVRPLVWVADSVFVEATRSA